MLISSSVVMPFSCAISSSVKDAITFKAQHSLLDKYVRTIHMYTNIHVCNAAVTLRVARIIIFTYIKTNRNITTRS